MTTYWHDLDLAGGRDRSAMTARSTPATARAGGRSTPSGLASRHRGWHLTMRGKFLAAVVAGLVVGFACYLLVAAGMSNWAATRTACEQGLRQDINCPIVGAP